MPRARLEKSQCLLWLFGYDYLYTSLLFLDNDQLDMDHLRAREKA